MRRSAVRIRSQAPAQGQGPYLRLSTLRVGPTNSGPNNPGETADVYEAVEQTLRGVGWLGLCCRSGEVISPIIIKWVEVQVPDQIGDGKYLPHLVSAGKFDELKIFEAEPFDAFDVHPAAVAVYYLGTNGTARKLLRDWPLTQTPGWFRSTSVRR
jgi:hypothetical protein